ncbi:MAG TPA: hypothetical protein DIU15_10000 [Deltaproteobacteria bacterium]|mgnify:CR=1 FL=1|nr:hypothetical protein [Deltaproteobacteria bacterium]
MSAPLSPSLQRNLQALLQVDRALAERICGPVGDQHLREEEDGSLSYRIHRSWHSLTLTPGQVEEALQPVGDAREVLVIGAGMGELIDPLIAGPKGTLVTVWDSDPYLLRLLLSRKDYSQSLMTRRLKLSLCADLMLEITTASAERATVFHPFLAPVYNNESRLVVEGLRDQTALVCEGGLFVDDLAQALRAEGLSVVTWPLTRLSPDELMRLVLTFQPKFVASINYFHGLAEACADANLPLIAWEIDPSTDRLAPTGVGDVAHVFTYRKANVEVFQKAGFFQTEYLPLAADIDKRRPLDLSHTDSEYYGSEVSFVGNSMVAQGQLFKENLCDLYVTWKDKDEASARAEIEEHLSALLTAQAQDYTQFHLPEMLEERLPQFVAAMRSEDKTDPVTLVAEMAAADKRILYVSNLGQVDVKVWGDEGWRHTTEHGARYMGPAGHHDELTKIYASTGINVDIGRLYQSDIVTMRVFDVLACGGFLLAEYSDALVELFEPGTHLDCYRDLSELLEKVEYYLEHKEEAAAIARAGMAAVRERHTIQLRLQHMLLKTGLARHASNANPAGAALPGGR